MRSNVRGQRETGSWYIHLYKEDYRNIATWSSLLLGPTATLKFVDWMIGAKDCMFRILLTGQFWSMYMTVGPTNPMVSTHGTKFHTTAHPTVLPLQTIGSSQPTTVAAALLVLSMLKGSVIYPWIRWVKYFGTICSGRSGFLIFHGKRTDWWQAKRNHWKKYIHHSWHDINSLQNAEHFHVSEQENRKEFKLVSI